MTPLPVKPDMYECRQFWSIFQIWFNNFFDQNWGLDQESLGSHPTNRLILDARDIYLTAMLPSHFYFILILSFFFLFCVCSFSPHAYLFLYSSVKALSLSHPLSPWEKHLRCLLITATWCVTNTNFQLGKKIIKSCFEKNFLVKIIA